MKGDFTRVTFDPNRHYSRVLMQQGRVQLDADWNEQAAILLHYLQALAADLIGPYGGPDSNLLGFALSVADPKTDFVIGAGHYYVDGLLSENDDGQVSYFTQHDYQDDYTSAKRRSKLPPGNYLAYLDVWEHHVTSLEDNHIREVALGGPDTATRAQIVWQVKLDALDRTTPPPADIHKNWQTRVDQWQPPQRGSLRVRLKPTEASTDPCTIPPSSAYRGQENQLYRVEIHAGGKLIDDPKPSFKWSRDNGSTVAAWEGNTDDDGLILSSVRGFAGAPRVEITSAADDLHAKVGELLKVVKLEGDALYVEKPQAWDKATARKVRRWDQIESETVALAKDGAVPLKEGTAETDWIDLEDGIQVQFQPPPTGQANQYRPGDYWLIPARTNGTIEWPLELDKKGQPQTDAAGHVIPRALAPYGILHHYAPLGIITTVDDGTVTVKDDLRRKFPAGAK